MQSSACLLLRKDRPPASLGDNMPVELYHFESSVPSRVVRMVARHINLDLTLKELDIFKGEQRKPEFLKINPEQTVPTIVDDGFVLSESRAIITYLVRKYAPDSPVYPKGARERALVDKILMYDIGTFYKKVGDYFYPVLMHKQPYNPEREAAMAKELTFVQTFLVGRKYMASDELSLADFALLGTLTLTEIADYSLDGYPQLKDYYENLKAELPYFEEINRKGIDFFKAYAKR
ncbi:glutathione S-transferase 1-like [Ixodes scapularis]